MASGSKNILGPNGKPYQFSYDAVTHNSGRRRPLSTRVRKEDREFRGNQKQRLIATSKDLYRNSSVARWAVNLHLDYVSSFSFQASTGNKELDNDLDRLVKWWSEPENCDAAGRFSLSEIVRQADKSAVIDGDCFINKLDANGVRGKVQMIEADRVRNPNSKDVTDYDPKSWSEGVRITGSGRPLAYSVCDRTDLGLYETRSIIPAQYVYHHSYFERPTYDQTRGVSPLASALNSYIDLYESKEYAIAKAKLAQIFGFKRTIDASKQEAEFEGQDEGDGDNSDHPPREIDLTGAPQIFDCEEDEDISLIESKTPSTEFQSFIPLIIQDALKALDIPYSFYAENYTNYSGARQALLQYQLSAERKQHINKKMLNNLLRWRITLWVRDGQLVLPVGWTIDDLVWEWIPKSIGWIDPNREVKANVAALEAGITSRQILVKQQGRDWGQVVKDLAYEKQVLAEAGISNDLPGASTNIQASNDDDEESDQSNE